VRDVFGSQVDAINFRSISLFPFVVTEGNFQVIAGIDYQLQLRDVSANVGQ
jgi:hypothetical protein